MRQNPQYGDFVALNGQNEAVLLMLRCGKL